jgi:hypothetical protein
MDALTTQRNMHLKERIKGTYRPLYTMGLLYCLRNHVHLAPHRSLIRGNLIFFHFPAMKITTQMRLTSNSQVFV